MAQLRLCMTPATRHTLEHILQVDPDAQLKVSEVLDKLEAHIKARRNETLCRRDFYECRQQEGEGLEAFTCRLRLLGSDVSVCSPNTK